MSVASSKAIARKFPPANPQPKGYSMDAAWKAASEPDMARSVCDLLMGGYAAPLGPPPKKIKPPSRTKPILAKVAGGKIVSILPTASFGLWYVTNS